MKQAVLSVLVLLVISTSLWADAPLASPQDHIVRSPNGRFAAKSTVFPPRTIVTDVATSKTLWSKEGFYRALFLADDGRHLVISYSDLLPVDFSMGMALLEFFDGPKSIRRISVGEIIGDKSQLKRTVSHLEWGRSIGIDGEGHFCVESASGHQFKFDVTTGIVVADQKGD